MRARVEAQQSRDLAPLRRVRDRIDWGYAEPLNVETLARRVHSSAGHQGCHLAWRNRSPDRSGIEKQPSPSHN